MAAHALLSPSGFQALMLCPAKPAMERGRPDDSSEYADEGTAAHYLGAQCLMQMQEATSAVGDVIAVHPEGECDWLDGMPNNRHPASRYFKVDADFAEAVQIYINAVRDYTGDGELFVEQALPIDHVTGEEDAEGTGDTVIVRGDELTVIDLKFGRGVEVSAEDNPQLKLYALGALRKFDLVGDIKRVRMVISQPRITAAPSEAVCTVEELQAWARDVATPAADKAMEIYTSNWPFTALASCNPHEDACRFCKAKADCKALADKVQTAMGMEFTDLTTADKIEAETIVEASVTMADAAGELGARMDAVPLVEMWCKAIRGKVEKHLLAGKPVEGYKLVAGRKGARGWKDAVEAESALKRMRLKKEQMYDFSLISPTTAEKVLKATPKRWTKVLPLIEQADGKPSVAPLADKRPALEIQPVAAEFTPITDPVAATADDLV